MPIRNALVSLMQYSAKRRLKLIGKLVAVGCFYVSATNCIEAADAFNPLRGSEDRLAEIARVQTIFGSPVVKESTKLGDTHETRNVPETELTDPGLAIDALVNSFELNRRSQKHASAHQPSQSAKWSAERCATPPGNHLTSIAKTSPVQLDGSYLPPTVGGFQRNGREWVFVPAAPTATIFVAKKTNPAIPNNQFRCATDISRFCQETNRPVELEPTNPLRVASLDATKNSVRQAEIRYDRQPFAELTVADDLALGRVIEMIEAGNCENQWVVSGALTSQSASPIGKTILNLRSAVPTKD